MLCHSLTAYRFRWKGITHASFAVHSRVKLVAFVSQDVHQLLHLNLSDKH